MPQAGLLVQLDGSHHDWLEGRGPRLVLQGAIDDATNAVPAATFRDEEDAAGYLWVLREMGVHCGLPLAVYSDRHGIFTPNPKQRLTLEDQLQGLSRPRSQVGRALAELQIRWIPATSPQATDEIVKSRRYPGRGSGRKMRVDAGDPRPKSGAWGWKPRRTGCPSGR